MEGNPQDPHQHVTLKELKSNLRDNLKQSGVLNTVKARIRKEFISNMYAGGKKSLQPANNLTPLFERALFSSIYHCLKARRLINTLSVFAAESGIENQSPLSELDILQALQFGSRSSLYMAVKKKVENKGVDENSPSHEQSVLEMMITDGVSKLKNGSCDAICQTDQGQSVRDFLVEQNIELHNKYMAQLEEDKKAPVRSIEERMITFERECEERYRKDLEAQTAYVRDVEVKKMREDEKTSSRMEIDRLRRDLENEYQQRIALYNQREEELTKNQLSREKAMEKSLYESRQYQLKEMENIKMREAAATKKFELESQGLKTLENRLSEAQASYEIREKELGRREKVVEEKAKDFLGKAREDASKALSLELEALSRDKQSLKDERERFEEEKKSQTELIAGSTDALAKVREMQQILLQKEEEFLAAKQEILLLQSYRNDDESKVAEMLNVPIDSLIGPNTKEYLIKLMRHVTDLKQQGDENKAIRREMKEISDKNRTLLSKEEMYKNEVSRLKLSVRQVQEKFKAEMIKAENDINSVSESKIELSVKLQEYTKRCTELEALVENQTFVNNRMDRLQRVNNKINASKAAVSSSSSTIRPGDKFFSSEIDSLLYKPPSTPTLVRNRSSSPEKYQNSGLSITDIQELVDRQVAAELSSKQAEAPPPIPPAPVAMTYPPMAYGYPPMGYSPMYLPPPQQQQQQPANSEGTENLTKAFAEMMQQQREAFEKKLNEANQSSSAAQYPVNTNFNSTMDSAIAASAQLASAPEVETPTETKDRHGEKQPASPVTKKLPTPSSSPAQASSSSSPLPTKAPSPSKEDTVDDINRCETEVPMVTQDNEDEWQRKIEAEKAIAYNRQQALLEEERIEAQRRKREEERKAARNEQEELEKELKRKKEEEEETRKKLEEEEKARLKAEEDERKKREEERLAEIRRKEEEKNKDVLEAQRKLQAEKDRKEDEDKAAIKAAREKVLARRRKSAAGAASDTKDDSNKAQTSSTGGGRDQVTKSPENSGGDASLNNTTYDDMQTGFEASPRGGNTSYDSGW